MSYIFIIAQHRTGSTLLKNMLDANSEVVMAFDEMNIFEPLRSNTLDRLLEKEIKNPGDLIKAIQNKKIHGTFWRDFEQSGITTKELLKELESNEHFNIQIILKNILDLLQRNHGKKFSGIKYPVHFSKFQLLKEWFPESKIIFLTRNPKSIIASKLNDPATLKRKKKSIVHRLGVHYFTLFYFCREFCNSIGVFQKNNSDVFKITYEDLVNYPKESLEKLCNYCHLEFEDTMLTVDGKSSSYKSKDSRGNLERYKNVLSSFDQWLIDLLTKKDYNKVATNH